MPVARLLHEMTTTELEGWWQYFEQKEKAMKNGN
jgi:hypothetical protein